MNIKKELVELSKVMEQKGFVNAYQGNISIIDRSSNKVYITPSATRKLTLTEDMIAVIDMDGNKIEGTGRPSSEYRIHLAAYKFRKDCNAVVHCHPPYLTAFAIMGKDIEIDSHADFVHFLEIPLVSFGEQGTDAIIGNLDDCLKYHDMALLENHGVVCVGKDLSNACRIVEGAENTVHSWVIAKQVGIPKRIPIFSELYKAQENKVKGK